MSPLAPIGAVAPMPFGPIGGAGDSASTPAAGGGFADVLSGAVAGLNGQLVGSERMAEAAATGAMADPTEALVAVEKADLAFQTAVQVRNKLVEGWQEISRMQV